MRIKSLVEEAFEDLNVQLNLKVSKIDEKFYSFRREFDFDQLSRMIKSKADKYFVDDSLKVSSEKIESMDSNIVCIA